MSPDLRAELLCAAILLSQSDIDCRAPGAPLLVASDASQHAEAAVAASVPEPFSREALPPEGLVGAAPVPSPSSDAKSRRTSY